MYKKKLAKIAHKFLRIKNIYFYLEIFNLKASHKKLSDFYIDLHIGQLSQVLIVV